MRPNLLVDPAVRGSVVDEDADDVHVAPPCGQVQREASLAVRHVCGRLELQQLQDHFPADIHKQINIATDQMMEGWRGGKDEELRSILWNTVTFLLTKPNQIIFVTFQHVAPLIILLHFNYMHIGVYGPFLWKSSVLIVGTSKCSTTASIVSGIVF